MAYISSSCPLPQNGLLPPPQRCVDRSNAAVALADWIAAEGQGRVYNAVPRLASFRPYGSGVVVSAAIMTRQSELARASVISAGAPPAATSTLVGSDDTAAPTVVPLNWIPGVERVSDCAPRVPAATAVSPAPGIVMPERLGERSAARALAARPGAGRLGERRNAAGRTTRFPAWADAAVYQPAENGLAAWLQQNIWLVVGVAALGLVAYTGKQGR